MIATINLGTEVMVSDPCYEIPTWCQERIRNMVPGEYNVIVNHLVSWGVRPSEIIAVNQEKLRENGGDVDWQFYSNQIGVDSGQAGIFDIRDYRNNDVYLNEGWIGEPNHLGFNLRQEGELFYAHCCDMTINTDEGCGIFPRGVVSRSGYGDGSYELWVNKREGKDSDIWALRVIFIREEYEQKDEQD